MGKQVVRQTDCWQTDRLRKTETDKSMERKTKKFRQKEGTQAGRHIYSERDQRIDKPTDKLRDRL